MTRSGQPAPTKSRLGRPMTPLELIARLATLIPPLRHPLIRSHGVFAPDSAWRASFAMPRRTTCAIPLQVPASRHRAWPAAPEAKRRRPEPPRTQAPSRAPAPAHLVTALASGGGSTGLRCYAESTMSMLWLAPAEAACDSWNSSTTPTTPASRSAPSASRRNHPSSPQPALAIPLWTSTHHSLTGASTQAPTSTSIRPRPTPGEPARAQRSALESLTESRIPG